MSLLNPATAYRRSTSRPWIPVVLPLVRIDVDKDGLLDVTVDELPFPSQDTGGECQISRAGLRQLLDQIATEHDSALRVEIHEPDGKVFTDFHTPKTAPIDRSHGPAVPPSTHAQDVTARRTTLSAQLGSGEVTGTGFADGEEITIAVVIYRSAAEADGSIELRLPVALLERHSADMVLLGATSGAVSATPPKASESVREAS
ncbi:hypothetical protein [Nocardioides jensenii]|uniref:hypothetical protein n=1 Tax=Nocardioides jensenii TaxID=1843 RepID=UPI00082BBF5E|nr:hypothetical protein [Nocardioides jensenii]